jgi:hypothetical protein
VQNAFIQDLIDNDKLGPCLEIKYFFTARHPTPSVPSQYFAEDLINGSHIILKLVYWFSGYLYAYSVSFNSGNASGRRLRLHPLTGSRSDR